MFNVKVDSLSSNMAIENLSSCKQWFTYPEDMSKKLKKNQSDHNVDSSNSKRTAFFI